MLFLLFQLGSDRFALDIRQIVEVLPFIDITRVSRMPPSVAGVLNYRGVPVPVIDLSQLMLDRPALRRLNTRIVVVHCAAENGETRLLGLIAERATEMSHLRADAFKGSAVVGADVRHVSHVTVDEDGLIQRLDVNRLLPGPVRELLFQQPQAS